MLGRPREALHESIAPTSVAAQLPDRGNELRRDRGMEMFSSEPEPRLAPSLSSSEDVGIELEVESIHHNFELQLGEDGSDDLIVAEGDPNAGIACGGTGGQLGGGHHGFALQLDEGDSGPSLAGKPVNVSVGSEDMFPGLGPAKVTTASEHRRAMHHSIAAPPGEGHSSARRVRDAQWFGSDPEPALDYGKSKQGAAHRRRESPLAPAAGPRSPHQLPSSADLFSNTLPPVEGGESQEGVMHSVLHQSLSPLELTPVKSEMRRVRDANLFGSDPEPTVNQELPPPRVGSNAAQRANSTRWPAMHESISEPQTDPIRNSMLRQRDANLFASDPEPSIKLEMPEAAPDSSNDQLHTQADPARLDLTPPKPGAPHQDNDPRGKGHQVREGERSKSSEDSNGRLARPQQRRSSSPDAVLSSSGAAPRPPATSLEDWAADDFAGVHDSVECPGERASLALQETTTPSGHVVYTVPSTPQHARSSIASVASLKSMSVAEQGAEPPGRPSLSGITAEDGLSISLCALPRGSKEHDVTPRMSATGSDDAPQPTTVPAPDTRGLFYSRETEASGDNMSPSLSVRAVSFDGLKSPRKTPAGASGAVATPAGGKAVQGISARKAGRLLDATNREIRRLTLELEEQVHRMEMGRITAAQLDERLASAGAAISALEARREEVLAALAALPGRSWRRQSQPLCLAPGGPAGYGRAKQHVDTRPRPPTRWDMPSSEPTHWRHEDIRKVTRPAADRFGAAPEEKFSQFTFQPATWKGGARPHMHSFSAFDTFLGLPDFEERVAREIEVSRDANALLDTILDAGAACGLSEREVLAWVQEHVQECISQGYHELTALQYAVQRMAAELPAATGWRASMGGEQALDKKETVEGGKDKGSEAGSGSVGNGNDSRAGVAGQAVIASHATLESKTMQKAKAADGSERHPPGPPTYRQHLKVAQDHVMRAAVGYEPFLGGGFDMQVVADSHKALARSPFLPNPTVTAEDWDAAKQRRRTQGPTRKATAGGRKKKEDAGGRVTFTAAPAGSPRGGRYNATGKSSLGEALAAANPAVAASINSNELLAKVRERYRQSGVYFDPSTDHTSRRLMRKQPGARGGTRTRPNYTALLAGGVTPSGAAAPVPSPLLAATVAKMGEDMPAEPKVRGWIEGQAKMNAGSQPVRKQLFSN